MYHKSSLGEECKENRVINSEDVCIVAADTWGLNYVARTSNRDIPKGCYWSSSDAYYNDYSTVSSKPAFQSHQGGICQLGIRFIITLLESCNQYFKMTFSLF